MSTMKEMAAEYRVAAAKLKMKIDDLSADGQTPLREIQAMRAILEDIREVQRLLDGYYNIPRTKKFSAAGWKARMLKKDETS